MNESGVILFRHNVFISFLCYYFCLFLFFLVFCVVFALWIACLFMIYCFVALMFFRSQFSFLYFIARVYRLILVVYRFSLLIGVVLND